jgi:hypothetical protein
MSAQQDTLDRLNAARDELTDFILAMTARPGTPAWADLRKVIERRDQLTVQIQQVITAAFNAPMGDITGALAQLQDATDRLAALDKTLKKVAQVIEVADSVVQAAASVLEIAGV